MARKVLMWETFNAVAHINHLNDIEQAGSQISWSGTGASLGAGYSGGQALVGPSSFTWNDVSDFYGSRKSGGIRVRWKLSTLGVSNLIGELITNQGNVGLTVNSSNQLTLTGIPGGTITSTTTVSSATWYVSEFWFAIDNSNGAYRVVHEGAEIASLTATGQDTLSTGSKVTGVLFHNANLTIAEVIYLGELSIFDEAMFLEGSARTAKVAVMAPDSSGFYSDGTILAPNAGEARWEDIDERPSDGNTSAIRLGATGTRVSVGVANLSNSVLGAAQILALQTVASHANEAGANRLRTFIRANGVNYAGTTGVGAGTTNSSGTILTDGGGVTLEKFRTDVILTEPETAVDYEDMEPDDVLTAINAYELGFEQIGAGFPTTITLGLIEVLYLSGANRSSGIVLRGKYDASGGIDTGYVFQVDLTPFNEFQALIRRVAPGGISTDIATRDVTTGFSLAIDTNFTLRASIENVDGTGPDNGVPRLEMAINGTTVNSWTPLIAGIDEVSGGRLQDETLQAILQGTSQGLYLQPPAAGAGFLYYSDWTDDFTPPDDEDDPEDEPSIPVGVECSGKVGTFVAPIGSRFSVEVGSMAWRHRYETGHLARILRDPQQRRVWRIEMPQGLSEAERSALHTFWNSHGKAVPFDFADPDTGEVVCAHFKDDSLKTILQSPLSRAYEAIVEELIDSAVSMSVTPAKASLVITGRVPSITNFTPLFGVLLTRRYNPTVVATYRPGSTALSDTSFAPKVVAIYRPGSTAVATATFAPTVVIA